MVSASDVYGTPITERARSQEGVTRQAIVGDRYHVEFVTNGRRTWPSRMAEQFAMTGRLGSTTR